MSDRFVNGLKLTAPTASQCGRTFSRWLVEWLTQVCGWTVLDSVSGNWTNTVATGTGAVGVSGQPSRLDIGANAYNFTSSDVGSYLTLTGFSGRFASRNGIYVIRSVVSSKVVDLDVEHSVHEDGFASGTSGISWRLWAPTASYTPTSTNVIVLAGSGTTGGGYAFHIHITVRSTNAYFPEFRLSPFASWNATTHAWNDSRWIAATGIDNFNNSIINTDVCRVWGAADADRAVVMVRIEDDYYSWGLVYLGEIDPKDSATDPKPCVVWTGTNRGNSTVGDDNATLIGYGQDSSIGSGGRWLGYDNLTTVTGYAVLAHTSPSQDVHWLSDTQRYYSERSRLHHRQPIVCESRTTGFMELRGALRRVWSVARDLPRLKVLGLNGEFLHVVGGILIPWLNSKVWYERG